MSDATKFKLITATFIMLGILSFSFSKSPVKPKPLVVTVDPVNSVKIEEELQINYKSLPLREQVYLYLTENKKLSRNHALGLIANIDRESGFKLDILGDSNESGGLFQWHKTRFSKMKKAIPNWKKSWRDQVDYALQEFVGPEWCEMSFVSAEQAGRWWAREWEKPANLMRAYRKHKGFIKSYKF